MSERLNELNARVREHLSFVLEQQDELDKEIAAKEAELKELKEARSRARQLAHLIDPQQPPGRGQRTAKKESSYSLKAAPETVDRIYDWLRENVNGQVFSGPELIKERGFNLTSQATLTAALIQLQNQGRVRLDSVGGPQSTTRKNWKLTEAGD